MALFEAVHRFSVEDLVVEVYRSEAELGWAAAANTARVLSEAVADHGSARVVLATGNSQLACIAALASHDVPWERVSVFHMDEYVGMDEQHPASFRRWIRERVEEPFRPASVCYIAGDAQDVQAECDRYEAELRSAPLDLVCMGIGENGHLAFNEPFEARFDDDRWVREITLTPESRAQQVGEGHFPTIDAAPPTAITLTIPALLSAAHVQVCVPERRKATAVAAALRDAVTTACPATILRRYPQAKLFLEPESAGLVDLDSVVDA